MVKRSLMEGKVRLENPSEIRNKTRKSKKLPRKFGGNEEKALPLHHVSQKTKAKKFFERNCINDLISSTSIKELIPSMKFR